MERVLPDPLTVLEVTLGPAARIVGLDGVHVVRTTERPDHAPGNAVHHGAAVAPEELPAAVADLDRRFPTGRSRLVVPWTEDLVEGDGALRRRSVSVWLRDGAHPAPRPPDLALAPPGDDRAWHGLTVLQRHAAPPGEDRGRGAEDDRLRWWVEGLRTLVGEGRARVLRGERFGTPVAAGVLHWAPGIEVGTGAAGLAVVAGVVVHPAHRHLGIGRAVAAELVARHLADFPHAAVAAVVPGATTTPPPVATGWRGHADLLALTRA